MVVDESRANSVGKLFLVLQHAYLVDGFVDAALLEVAEGLPKLEEGILSGPELLRADLLSGLPHALTKQK